LTDTGSIAVIGAGSWGTALANLVAEQGIGVELWSYEPEIAEQINGGRENSVYLPGATLSEHIAASSDIERVICGKDIIFIVVPSHVYRSVAKSFNTLVDDNVILVSATKGIENETCCLMSDIIAELFPPAISGRSCFLSGPSFAREVALRLPTAVTVASKDQTACETIQKLVSCSYFRAYTSDDVIGVELGGAVKNVIAIAAGASDGLKLGDNARAGLITRGLAEMARLGIAMGANPLTFSGLAGMGDLVLTCAGDLSRNRTFGYRIAKGETMKQIVSDMVMVAEGVKTSKSVSELSKRQKVELPICQAVYSILYEDKSPLIAVSELMERDLKSELQGITRSG